MPNILDDTQASPMHGIDLIYVCYPLSPCTQQCV